MTEKPLIIVLDNLTKQDEYVKKRIIEALEDLPKPKIGYLVMEMKDKGDLND